MTLHDFKTLSDSMAEVLSVPMFFIGHGSPMNAIADNPFTKSLGLIGSSLPEKPKAILVISGATPCWATVFAEQLNSR